MAVSVIFPVSHVEDANGLPYVGARQLVYEAGTTTLRPVFTDAALSTPAANPQISNAKGDFPRVFTAPGTYKVRQEQAIVYPATSGVLIAECDDIDSGLSAGTVALGIDRGGTGATTAAAARANLDVPSNSELAALSAQIATLSASLQNLASFPQGRLTLTSGTPILATSVSSASTVYYTPYTGQLCPVWDGAQYNLKVFTELSLSLGVSHVLNSIYDIYLINDATDGIKIVTSAAWSNIGAGTSARTGTADISRLQGLWVNAAQQTMRNGATTYIVPANYGTYIGSIYIDGTAGQVSCLMSWGQNRKWGVWNAYNRNLVSILAGDNTAGPWSAASSFPNFSASNGNSANRITSFTGLPEEEVRCSFEQIVSAVSATNVAFIGIGLNSTTTSSGTIGQASSSNATALRIQLRAEANLARGIGINNIQSVEACTTAATMYGTQNNMVLMASYNA